MTSVDPLATLQLPYLLQLADTCDDLPFDPSLDLFVSAASHYALKVLLPLLDLLDDRIEQVLKLLVLLLHRLGPRE